METITELKKCFYAIRQIEQEKKKGKDCYVLIHQYFVELDTILRKAAKYSTDLPNWSNRIEIAHFHRASARLHRIQRAYDLH